MVRISRFLDYDSDYYPGSDYDYPTSDDDYDGNCRLLKCGEINHKGEIFYCQNKGCQCNPYTEAELADIEKENNRIFEKNQQQHIAYVARRKRAQLLSSEALYLLRRGDTKKFAFFYRENSNEIIHDQISEIFWEKYSTRENVEILLDTGVKVCRPYGFFPLWFNDYFKGLIEENNCFEQQVVIISCYLDKPDCSELDFFNSIISEFIFSRPEIVKLLMSVSEYDHCPHISKIIKNLSDEDFLRVYKIIFENFGDCGDWDLEKLFNQKFINANFDNVEMIKDFRMNTSWKNEVNILIARKICCLPLVQAQNYFDKIFGKNTPKNDCDPFMLKFITFFSNGIISFLYSDNEKLIQRRLSQKIKKPTKEDREWISSQKKMIGDFGKLKSIALTEDVKIV